MTTVSTGAIGFVFEDLMTSTFNILATTMRRSNWKVTVYTEQNIRDTFAEQSLNGVDHLVELEDPSGAVTLCLLQEKWKIMTNQREVSQFLDCCARILNRIPAARRQRVLRLWVTRSQPSSNGEKSLLEGGAHTIQCVTSQPLLAQITVQYICELIGYREFATDVIATMPSLLSTEMPTEPELLDGSKLAVSTPLNSKTKITVHKRE